MARIAVLVAAAALIAACAQYTLVKPQRVSIGGAYTVEAQIFWSKVTEGKTEVWTVDGPLLQALRFVKGLEEGGKLFRGKNRDKMPPFNSKMTAIEIKEFFEGSLALLGAAQVKTTNFRPENFGNVSGFRFDLAYATGDGLENQGFVVGAVKDKKLYLIIYAGTRLYHYGKHKEDVERLIRSIRML